MSAVAAPGGSRRDRVRGALLGAALGDGVGAAFEGRALVGPDEVALVVAGTAPLAWTDDTALAVALGEHLAGCLGGGADLDEGGLARALARAWAEDPGRGYGSLPPRVFDAVLSGRDWRAVTASAFGGAGSLGNGGAMRVVPVACAAPDSGRVAELARRSAAVTHAHPLGRSGAAVQALAVHDALLSDTGVPPDAAATLAAAAVGATRPEEAELASALSTVSDLVEGNAAPREAAAVLGAGVAAAESVPMALFAALGAPASVVATIERAVLGGGDTDTIAAMAGAVTGARCGASTIPTGLVSRLEQSDRLLALADALADLPGSP